MIRPLVIVDSPVKAQTIKDQFADEMETFLVQAAPLKVNSQYVSRGDGSGEMTFSFAPSGASGLADEIARNLDRDIYLALGRDPRGEYWSWMVSEYVLALSKGAKAPRRLNVFALTSEALGESFKLVEPVLDQRAKAYYYRGFFNACLVKHIQRLIGTTVGPQGLPLDYTTLTMLFVLVDRELQLKELVHPPRWRVRVRLATRQGELDALLAHAAGISEDGLCKDASEGKRILDLFRDLPLTVVAVERSEAAILPRPPYQLAELLHDAVVTLGLSPGEAHEILASLFCGIPVGDRQVGLISALDRLDVASGAILASAVRRFLASGDGRGLLDEEGAAEEPGEGAIFPSQPEVLPEALAGTLSPSAATLYRLIRARGLACQTRPASAQRIEATLSAGSLCRFVASGTAIDDPGFLALDEVLWDPNLPRDCPLEALAPGQELVPRQIIPEPSTDFMPEYYTLESLFVDLADFSIGIESSTIATLQQMLDEGYLTIGRRGELRCQDNAFKVANTINRAFPAMTGINLSAYMEQVVTELLSGRKSLEVAVRQFDQTLFMQGKPLVRVSVDRPLPRRERTSRHVIKAAAPAAVAEEVPSPEAEADVPPAGSAGVPGAVQAPAAAPAVDAGGPSPLAAPAAESGTEARPAVDLADLSPEEEDTVLVPVPEAPSLADVAMPAPSGEEAGEAPVVFHQPPTSEPPARRMAAAVFEET
ncbi:MAG: DNA topoisomerase, partial [Thermodesulfobacteriota bacterium]